MRALTIPGLERGAILPPVHELAENPCISALRQCKPTPVLGRILFNRPDGLPQDKRSAPRMPEPHIIRLAGCDPVDKRSQVAVSLGADVTPNAVKMSVRQ